MTFLIYAGIILGAGVLLCIGIFIYEFKYQPRLKRDKYNPYTFWCKDCGMQFNTFGILGCTHHDTIEPVGKITNPNCRCLRKFRDEDWFKENTNGR